MCVVDMGGINGTLLFDNLVFDGNVGKTSFVSHTKHTAEATNTDLLHL